MKTQEAKQLSLPELLAQLGYKPTKVSGKKLWYKSPLHQERTPSFCVEPGHTLAWIFSDYGANIKGNILDFAMNYQDCSLAEALAWLSQMFEEKSKPYSPPYQHAHRVTPRLQILRLKPIQHTLLRAYLNQRTIPIEIAQRYLTEVHYLNNGHRYFALGWRTDMGGWCLRTHNFKTCVQPAGITHIGLASDQIAIFEGMFDFLAALAYYQKGTPRGQVIILNSVAHIQAAMEKINNKNYQNIRLYLDNDDAGRKATENLLVLKNAIDCSSVFSPAKDFAEWHETHRSK